MAEPVLRDVEQAVALMRQAAVNAQWNALTRFEQEVGVALNGHLSHGSSVADCPISVHWLTFAPRVSAAILAAWRFERISEAEQAALAALRGDA